MLTRRKALRSASGSALDRPSFEQQCAARRRIDAAEDVQQRGFAASGRTPDCQVLAASDLQRDVTQRLHRPGAHRKGLRSAARASTSGSGHDTTSFLSVVAIGRVDTSHIG